MITLSEINSNRPLTNAGVGTDSSPSPFKASELEKFVKLAGEQPSRFPDLDQGMLRRMASSLRLLPPDMILADGFYEHFGAQGEAIRLRATEHRDVQGSDFRGPTDLGPAFPDRPVEHRGEDSRTDLGPLSALSEPQGGVSTGTTGVLTNSILNPGGVGNVNTADPMWDVLGDVGDVDAPNRRDPILDPNYHIDNPDAVRTSYSGGVDPVISSIIGDGQPDPGPRIVERLLEIMGPYSAANKDALIQQLTYIAGTGIAYQTERAGANDTDTYSPNKTLRHGTGVCRDTHVAVSAIYASYVKAQESNGVWKPGNPTNCEDLAQTVGFFNPDEYHAYMVLKDPTTGKWAALEYGKYYDLNAPNALDAFAALPGYIGGYTRYSLRGWDSPPAVNDRGSIGAAMAKDFFREDVGEGERGETRILAGEHELGLTHFLTPHLALVGRMDPTSAADGNFIGGIKLNYHDDFERVDSRGYIHAAGGLFTHGFEARNSTGISDHSNPDRMSMYRMYVLGFQCDGRWESKAKELLGNKLRLEMGMDWDALLGLPISTGSEDGTKMDLPAVGDYSTLDVGADIGFSGHHFINESLRLDYKLVARAEFDMINIGTELITSEGESAESLTHHPWMARGAFGLTHKADNGMLTRFEFGMNQYLSSPFDPETMASGNHYAALTFAPNGDMSFGLLARGYNTDDEFVPMDGLGVTFNLNPNDKLRFSVGVEGRAPGGNFSNFGDHINVMGSLGFSF